MSELKETPKERVEIFLPSEGLVQLQLDLISKLSEILADSEVEAVGAVAVPVAGRKELDIMVISENILKDTEILSQNGYKKGPIENEISYLKSFEGDIEVGVQIIPVGHKMIDIHRKIISRLRGNEDLRKTYEHFKLSLDGLGTEEYKQNKSLWIKEHLLL